jgi:hypothetical protein
MKPMRLTMFAVLAAVIFCGCDKSSSRAAESTVPYALSGQTIARLHWLGKKQVAAETNSAGLMRIWNEPESARLEAQTLDKLSTAPWRLFPHVATTNTAAAQWLRPLLEDCVQQESYLEIRCVTNHPGELAFAIQLPDEHAALWETNLAAVLESLTGIHSEPAPGGWSLKKHELPNLIELARAGDWVVVGIGHEKNALLADFTARIQRNHSPVAGPDLNAWLNADLDLRSVAGAFKLDWNLPDGFPKVSLAVNGGGQIVRTRGKLDFPAPLKLDLEPWQIPFSLVHPPLSSFTAIRGLRPWLASLKVWNDLQIGAPPNQLFCWALQGSQQMTFFTTPLQDASNRVALVSDLMMEKYGCWFITNEFFSFKKSQTFNGLEWSGYPFLTPYLQSMTTSEGEFAYGGLFPRPPSQRPPPPELIQAILGGTNLVYYDWELTASRNEQWLYIGQFLRLVSHKAQLPNAACVAWFKASEPNLGSCLTQIARTAPEQLSFMRESSVGFSSFELHLLADWLESPQFPRGLHTLLVASPPLKAQRPTPPKTVGSPERTRNR